MYRVKEHSEKQYANSIIFDRFMDFQNESATINFGNIIAFMIPMESQNGKLQMPMRVTFEEKR